MKCSYCGCKFVEDKRGQCMFCGAPREEVDQEVKDAVAQAFPYEYARAMWSTCNTPVHTASCGLAPGLCDICGEQADGAWAVNGGTRTLCNKCYKTEKYKEIKSRIPRGPGGAVERVKLKARFRELGLDI